MQMIEQYAYKVTPVKGQYSGAKDLLNVANYWSAAKADYDASPVRGKAFCTLNRDEQVAIVRKYVNR